MGVFARLCPLHRVIVQCLGGARGFEALCQRKALQTRYSVSLWGTVAPLHYDFSFLCKFCFAVESVDGPIDRRASRYIVAEGILYTDLEKKHFRVMTSLILVNLFIFFGLVCFALFFQ